VRHAKQLRSTLHPLLFYRRNDKSARLLRETEAPGTREGIFLILGIVSGVINFSPPSAENLMPPEDYLAEYTPALQEIEDEQQV
jgi:hypothetical protein